MINNVCCFAPTKSVNAEINIINFVYQKSAESVRTITQATNALCLVTSGRGNLICNRNEYPLKRGDVFMIFSAKPFSIECVDNLQYLYVTFIGKRATALLDKIVLTKNSPVKEGFEFLIDLWIKSIETCTSENIEVMCEGLLLHAFSYLLKSENAQKNKSFSSNFLNLKNYVDLNYSNSYLNLNLLSEKFGYSSKYISNVFYKLVKKPFSKYLTSIRLENAVKLIESGYRNVGEVASLCGFSDQFYFSKVFKKEYKISPKNYVMKVANK